MNNLSHTGSRFKYNSFGSLIAFILTAIWTKIGVITVSDENLEYIFNLFITASLLATVIHMGGHFSVFKRGLLSKNQLVFLVINSILAVVVFIYSDIESENLSYCLAVVFVLKLYAESLLIKYNRITKFLISMALEPFMRVTLFFEASKELWIYTYLLLGGIYLLYILKFYLRQENNKFEGDKFFLSIWISEILGILFIKGDQYLGFKILSEKEGLLLFMLISFLTIPLKLVSIVGRAQGFLHLEDQNENKLYKKLLLSTVLLSVVFSTIAYLSWNYLFQIFYSTKWAIASENYKSFLLVVPVIAVNQVMGVKATFYRPETINVLKTLLLILKIILLIFLTDDLKSFLGIYTAIVIIQCTSYAVILNRV